MGNHHGFSPSKLQQMFLCPGSYRMQKNLPEVQTEFSSEGTMLHERVCDGNVAGLTQEQIELVNLCRDEIIGLPNPQHEILISVIDEDFNEVTYGTADFVSEGSEYVVGIDWKFGMHKVSEVKNNIQMAAYAAGLMLKYNKPVEMRIFQPRLRYKSSHIFNDANGIIATLKQIIAKSEEPNAPCIAGYEQCNYCKAKITCSSSMQFLADFAQTKEIAKVEHITDITSPEMLSDYMDKVKLARKICDSVEHAVKTYAMQNNNRCGKYFLKKKLSNRSIENTLKAYEVLSSLVTPEEFAGCCDVKIGEIESLFIQKAQQKAMGEGGKITAKTAKGDFNDLIAPCLAERKESFILSRDNEE